MGGDEVGAEAELRGSLKRGEFWVWCGGGSRDNENLTGIPCMFLWLYQNKSVSDLELLESVKLHKGKIWLVSSNWCLSQVMFW